MNPYIPQPTPFYGNFGRTTHRKPNCQNKPSYEQVVLAQEGVSVDLHTMQIKVEALSSVSQVRMVEWDTLTPFQVAASSSSFGTIDGKAAIVIPAQTIAVPGVALNKWYWFEVEHAFGIAYSECVYTMGAWPGTEGCGQAYQAVRLHWSSACPIHNGGYHQAPPYSMYVRASPGAPTWRYEEKGEEGADGKFIATFQKVEKFYEIEVVGPEYVADALSHIGLYESVYMEFADGETWALREPRAEVEWLKGNCLARIKFRFAQEPLTRQGCSTLCDDE
jgi:hypothetical protein